MSVAYLLDTNRLGFAASNVEPVLDRLAKCRRQGIRVGICVPILCELEVGIRQVKNRPEYRKSLARVMPQLRVWPIDAETAGIYGDVFFDLRRRGRILSQVDMLIAALAIQLKLTIVTTDRDFEPLTQIRTENWVQQGSP